MWNRWLDFIYFRFKEEELFHSVLGLDLLSLSLFVKKKGTGLGKKPSGMPQVEGKKTHSISQVIKTNLTGYKKLEGHTTKILTDK